MAGDQVIQVRPYVRQNGLRFSGYERPLPLIRTARERFDEKWVEDEDGHWIWTAGQRSGYGSFYNGEKSLNAHRAAWELYCGPVPDGLLVLHRCGIKLCVKPLGDAHLYLGTDADNFRDQLRLGERQTHLSEDGARTILLAQSSGLSQRAVARRFSVTHKTVGEIWRGETWPHLQVGGGE